MEQVVLGRTGLEVSVMGFGCGGPSRAGQSTGRTEAETVAVIREALDSGITLIDTAESYRTEHLVGEALKGRRREEIVLSTKKSIPEGTTPQQVIEGLEAGLTRLGTDHVDIYHLHGIQLERYQYCCDEIVPTLITLQEQGKIRFTGITERFERDMRHEMLQRALADDIWDVVMVGFNILNQSARHTVFPVTRAKDVGVLVMFAVRRALSRPEKLREVTGDLFEWGLLDAAQFDRDDPLGFLVREDGATSVTDAGYRFCRYEPGAHVVLSGTGSIDHLRENIASLSRPPLPEADVRRLEELFAGVDCVTAG